MPLVADRVVETTQTTGTGTLDLDGASTGFRSFVAGIGSGNTAAYVITDGVEWEVGTGVVTSGSPDTLSRAAVIASSNSDALVNWTNDNANERDVFCAPLASHVHPMTTRGDILRGDANGIVERLGLGTTGQVLKSNGLDIVFSDQEPAFPAGTLALFQQTAAPTGWTKETTHNDKGLRVVTGAASIGGATAFTSVFGSGKTADAHTLTTAEIPAHSHNIVTVGIGGSGNDRILHEDNTGLSSQSTDTDGGSGGGHSHTLSLDLQYVDVIIASKDA